MSLTFTTFLMQTAFKGDFTIFFTVNDLWRPLTDFIKTLLTLVCNWLFDSLLDRAYLTRKGM